MADTPSDPTSDTDTNSAGDTTSAPDAGPRPPRSEFWVQRRIGTAGTDETWVDSFALSHVTANPQLLDEALDDVRPVPSLRVVRKHIVETIEVIE